MVDAKAGVGGRGAKNGVVDWGAGKEEAGKLGWERFEWLTLAGFRTRGAREALGEALGASELGGVAWM